MGALGLGGVARAATVFDPFAGLEPIRARIDRIFRVTVCLRPFRAAGPRIEAEQLGRKLVVHNYGHGGSGWSLAWGSADVAVRMALADGARDIAVIGAGALGMAAAITAQRAGANVTIYAREQFPDVRSARATGTWSPDSRIAMANAVDATFGDRWEAMARKSFSTYQSYLGMPGNPVEWTDRYNLSALSPEERAGQKKEESDFLRLDDRLHDITPRSEPYGPGTHPFPTPFAYRSSSLTFNVADLARRLTNDFLIAGGRIVPMEFHEPSEIARLKQKVVINCTGYGARALWRDESIVPVRGQIAWLIPQAGATYGLHFGSLSVLARRDGIVVQELGQNEHFGYGDDNETPDRAAAEASVATLAAFYASAPPASPAA